MKIKDTGYVIYDVPGVDRIVVTADAGNPVIDIQGADLRGLRTSLAVTQLIDALVQATNLVERMHAQNEGTD